MAFNSANNYDLNEEVDDNDFLANSRSNYNKPSGAIADFERKQQLMLLKKTELENSCFQSTKNSLQLINESEEIGVKTGAELLEQKEKLNRINNDLDTIHGVSRQSQKNINAMNAGIGRFMFNGFKSIFTRSKDDKQDVVSKGQTKLTSSQSTNDFKDNHLNNTINKLRSNSTHDASVHNYTRPDTIMEERTTTQATKPKKDFNELIDDQLIDMQSGIGRLKELALGLGREIGEQNETLDLITSKADKTNTTIQVQNKQMLRQLGK